MSRPIFADPAASGFASRLTMAAEIVARLMTSKNLPEPTSVAVSDQAITVTPWLLCAECTALLAWAEHLGEPMWWKATVLMAPTATAGPVITIVAGGQLDRFRVELVTTTSRVPDAVRPFVVHRPQPLTGDAVRKVAALERAR
ncbi:hypothetical protein [Pseudonocardia acaciae]|uniref:hypothetical protein n=1 Tax=Pseudonocardia acaciae TaxID=551276 RepID=UPI00048A5C13|nr:hypothetical protein [Pseudonocardia acaciae]